MKGFSISVAALFFLLQSIHSQPYGELIGDRIVAFYPDNFVPYVTLPSMALLEEPDSIGMVPGDWKIFPEFYIDGGKNCASIETEEGTDLYGTGEVVGDLRRNNSEVTLWNTDNYGYWTDDGRRLYQSHPWILAVRADGSAYGILVDHTWRQTFYLDNPIRIVSDGPPFRIIIFERDSPQEVVETLAELTGKMPLPPLWALGYQQCRYSYYPASEVMELADTFREKQIPCDVIWMDIDYMDGYRIFTFDPVGFPNPSFVNTYLHDLGFHSVWMIDPGVKKESGYFVYDQGTSGDYWVQNSNGIPYYGDVWPGSCAFPDFTMPETRAWWAGLYTDFMATGVDGVWNDMNEPSVFNTSEGTMPENNIHRGGGQLPEDIHLRYHNVFGMLMVSATRQGIIEANPDKRPFVLTRANFLGGQRYAATWTGDNQSTWDHMKMSIPMLLNLGMSGQPFCGPDIGGFIDSPGAELLGQWMALGAFYPFARNHSSTSTHPQEPWAYGPETEAVSLVALQRRYRLLPYLYTSFYNCSQTGMPVMRPVFFADPNDLSLRDEQEAFMLGDDLLIIPAWAERPALPDGWWRNIFLIDKTKEEDGYQPLIKQKAGTVIPLAEIAQSTATYSADSITLLIAPNADYEANGELYADAGDGFDYLDDGYLQTGFTVIPTYDDSLLVSAMSLDGNFNAGDRVYKAGLITSYGIFYSDWKTDSVFKIPLFPDLYVKLSSPQNGDKFNNGDSIHLTVQTLGNLEISKMAYFNNETELIGEATTEPWEYIWQDVQTGIYRIRAVATSTDGKEIASEEAKIQVGKFGDGDITYQIWWNIGGGVLVSDLTSDPDYPDKPDETSVLHSFEAPNDIGDEFGARIIGYVYPPVTGNFSFWISGDDYCELWLSNDSTETNKQLVAEVPGWSRPDEWEKYSEQHSEVINLQKGEKYFIMALQKEAYDRDNLAVAWDYEGQSREIIPGDFLSPYDHAIGINENNLLQNTLSVYPNPARERATISFEGNFNTISVYTLKGDEVYRTGISDQQKTVKLSTISLSSGVYLVRLQGRQGTLTSRLVIVP